MKLPRALAWRRAARASRTKRRRGLSKLELLGKTAMGGLGVLAAIAFLRAGAIRQENIADRTYREALHSAALLTKSSTQKGIPAFPLHFGADTIPPGEDYCTMYSRLAALQLYHVAYYPAPAWEFAEYNRSIWKYPAGKWHPTKGTPVWNFLRIARPGHVFGIYYPGSDHVKGERPYSHTAVYLGSKNEIPYIMHRIGNEERVDSLFDFLRALSTKTEHNPQGEQAAVLEVIAPRAGT